LQLGVNKDDELQTFFVKKLFEALDGVGIEQVTA
jgi:hypothetical protein